MKTFFIIRAIDAFGAPWPLIPSTGIDGERHTSMEDAESVIAHWKADKGFRRDCRERCGWQTGTIRRLAVEEVKMS